MERLPNWLWFIVGLILILVLLYLVGIRVDIG